MKTISCLKDLEPFGVVPLTGEACGLMYRILCDVTERGRRVLARCLGVPNLTLADPWNRGSKDDPHVGSVMLAPQLLVPVGVFALLEHGCTEVWLYANGSLLGVEPSDTPERIELCRAMCPEALVRTFAPRGTAGDRNVHVMSGRVE